jgi:hypothetical protein
MSSTFLLLCTYIAIGISIASLFTDIIKIASENNPKKFCLFICLVCIGPPLLVIALGFDYWRNKWGI